MFIDSAEYYFPVEFVTLKDHYEGLIIYHENIINDENGSNENDEIEIEDKSSYKFVDPFHPSADAIDINDIYINDRKVINYNKVVITKSNRKCSIIDNNVWVTDGLSDDTFKQILNRNTYHSNIYTLSIFKAIQDMLNEIIDDEVQFNDDIKLDNGNLFRFNLKMIHRSDRLFKIMGFKKSQDGEEEKNAIIRSILSYRQLNNQDLALITREGIFIYTVVENFLTLRYFWSNEKWNDYYGKYKKLKVSRDGQVDDYLEKNYKELIKEILSKEFDDASTSLPSPNFVNIFEEFYKTEYKELVLRIIDDDPVEFSKFGSKILEIAIDKNIDTIVHKIFDKIGAVSTKNMMLLSFISLNLPKLCDHYYSTKYILRTSVILDPSCSSITNSKETSLDSYSKIPSINSRFKTMMISLYKNCNPLIQTQIETPMITFIVPFPQFVNIKMMVKITFGMILYINQN